MEQTALILIILTLLLLVLIVGLLTALVYKLFRDKGLSRPQVHPNSEAPHPDVSRSEFHPAILERMKQAERLKPRRPDLFCPNHAEEPGETMCAICDRLFCKSCVKAFKTMHFCKEHIPLIMQNDWDEVLTLKTSTTDPEQGVELYQKKKELFQKEDIPLFVETHYKINVDQDHIETYLVLFAQREMVENVRKKLSLFTNS